jgi:hypothetical protein
MPETPAPQIQLAGGNAGGIQFQVIGYADPANFPAGLDVTLTAPGALAPVGMLTVARGCLICVLPPDVSRAVLAQVALQQAPAGPGKVNSPGLKLV